MRSFDRHLVAVLLVVALAPRVSAQSGATPAWKGAQRNPAPEANAAPDGTAAPDGNAAPSAPTSAPAARYTALHEQDLLVINSVASTTGDFRSVIDRYWSFVRRYPTSGYADNALWQAANLSTESFRRFSEDRDQARAVQLLQWLRDQYPHSSLRAFALDRLAGREGMPADTVEQIVATDLPADRAPAPMAAAVPPNSPTSTVRGVQREVLPEVVRITVELDREVPFYQERIEGPARLFFDLKATRTVPALVDATFRYNSDIVRHIRLGRHPNNTTRIVLDLENVSRYSVFTLYNPYRIVIDAERAERIVTVLAARAVKGVGARIAAIRPRADIAPRPTVASTAPRAVSLRVAKSRPITPRALVATVTLPAPTALNAPLASVAPNVARVASTSTAGAATADKPNAPATRGVPIVPSAPIAPNAPSSVTADTETPDTVSAEKPTTSRKPVAPATNSSGKFSVARQLGLGVSRIVIDAGHGGHDPGASANGVSEAELVLDIALRLETLLLEQEGMDVVMTRRTNEYISLDERTEIANRESADLFLSIHANASANATARGVETYFLNFALNPQAEAVAARENAASGKTMNSLPSIIKAIALNNKLNESRDFAGSIQRALVRGMRPGNKTLRDLGVKQAPFMVLIGASMPSVLAEISFVTNRQEARFLKSPAYRQRIAESLFAGVLRYQESLKKVQTAALQ